MTQKITTILAGTFFVSFSSFSQFTQAFDVAKQLNPAMAGLEYKNSADLLITGTIRPYGSMLGLMGNYSGFNSKYKIGFGVNTITSNYIWNNQGYSNSNLTKLSINKQLDFNDKLKLSTGIGLGLKTMTYGGGDIFANDNLFIYKNALQVEMGSVLKSDRLEIGLSGGYQFAIGNASPDYSQILLNLSTSYTFGKADGLQFTPQFLFSNLGSNIGGSFKFKSKYILGGGMAGPYIQPTYFSPYLTAGYTIKEKFRINYTYNFRKGYGFPVANHALNLSLQLGKK